MTKLSTRILPFIFSFTCVWIVYAECGYYDETPVDICSYKSLHDSSTTSSSYTCKNDIINNSWYIVQNIFNGTDCDGEILQQIKRDCSNNICHCSVTSSGFDCEQYAIIKSEDFDYIQKKCDTSSYTESMVIVNQCINNRGMYKCNNFNLIFQSCNCSNIDKSVERPSLLPPSSEDEYNDCVSIKCVNTDTNHLYTNIKVSDNVCIPINVCQNQYSKQNGNSSWKYICNINDSKSMLQYNSRNCVTENADNIFDDDLDLFNHQKDVINCNKCDNYLKIKQYEVDMECNEENKRNYNWNEYIFPLGCHSFWFNNDIKHSISRDCTDSSYSVRKYSNGNCMGQPYGEYMVKKGCSIVEIFMYNKTYFHPSLIEIEKCDENNAESNNRETQMISCIISFVIVLFLICF
eukprot:440563_1